MNRSYTVPARFLTGNAAIPVVIVTRENVIDIVTLARRRRSGPRAVIDMANLWFHTGMFATRQNPFQDLRFATIDGKAIGAPYFQDPGREPASIAVWQPFRCIPSTFFVAVHARRGEGEITKVTSEPHTCCPIP